MATITKLGLQEAAQLDATHKINFTVSDISTATNITPFTIPANSRVTNVYLRTVTPWTGGTVSVATISVGDGASATQYITTQSVFTAVHGAAAASTNKVYTAADTLKLTMALTGAGPTAGSADVFLKLADFSRSTV